VKVGIVVPYSWSFWGAVVEHAELQSAALSDLGFDVRTIIANDPPGSFTRALHPRLGRHGNPPPDVIPVGRSVIVPANGSLPNLALSPRSVPRIKRVLERERFDVLHLHEPMTPAICVAVLAMARCPVVATFHASGELGWMRYAMFFWGALIDRIDHRIAVSEQARDSAARWLPGAYEIVPNGVLVPPQAEPGGRQHRIAFVGRHEPRKGLQVLLRAWPTVHAATGARLRLIGADPLAVGLLQRRLGVSAEGIDVLGFLSQDELTAELLSAKALAAPSIGGESFGMVLTRAFACALPCRGVGHPRLPRRRNRGNEPQRRTRRSRRPRAGAPRDPRRRAATPGDGQGGAQARAGGVRLGHDRAASCGRLRARDGAVAGRRARVNRVLHNAWWRAAVVLALLCVVIVMLWWRGPEWGLVADAFRLVEWTWIFAAIGLNLLSVVARALAWRTVVNQALREHSAPFGRIFSAFGIGLLANAVLPARTGELARVAVLTRRLPRGRGYTATLLGTVFTHRLFDVIPAMLLVVYVLLTAKIPHWALTSIVIAAALGGILLVVALITARLRKPAVDELSRLRRLLAMARVGLDVLRSPVGAALAIFFQCVGWLFQLLAVWVAMRAFDIDAPLPAAGLVLVLMNIATIFPLWPGNIGLLQAAVALPLVSYGVAYTTGFAYGLGLQILEMSVGVGVGIVFLAREGITFATLRRMPDQTGPRLRVVTEEEPARARSA
jgi:glycosyltransferase involved in cell wall biosynthesis/uncharacterized membrane protein YbhN (UPF0104 family)